MTNKKDFKIGLYASTAIVVGSVIGSGIFATPSGMAKILGSAQLLLFVWILGGVISLFGAFTQCELVAQMPRTGGLYEYFREIYGKKIAFLFGWSFFLIAGSGAIAALAYVFSAYLGEFIPLYKLPVEWDQKIVHLPLLGDIYPFADVGLKAVGVAMILLLTWINIRGIKLSAAFQSVSTTAKSFAILMIVAITLVYAYFADHSGTSAGASNYFSHSAVAEGRTFWATLTALTAALSGAFWSYSGWGSISSIAEEVHQPEKNIPRAILMGLGICIVLYVLINLAYLYVFPVEALGTVPQGRVASQTLQLTIGYMGASLIAALIVLSTFDNNNSTILTNARIYQAMAIQGNFFPSAGVVHKKYHTPHVSLSMQCAWAIVLLVSGSFDVVTGVYVFVNWSFYALIGIGVFIMRKRHPSRISPFRVPGYPWIPALFTLFALSFVCITFLGDAQSYLEGKTVFLKSVTGMLMVLTGLPLFWYFEKKYNPKEAI